MAERWAVWPATSQLRRRKATARGKLVPACVRNIVETR